MRTTPQPRVDITQIFPELAPMAEQTVRLHPRRGPEPGIRESKMGGLFLWPTNEPWPVCNTPEWVNKQHLTDVNHPLHNDYYTGVLQLRAEDFPELLFPDDTNLFQLHWCPQNHENTWCYCRAFWRKEDDVKDHLSQIPSSRNPKEDYLPQPCCLYSERVTEYPSPCELPKALWEKINDWQEEQNDTLYQSLLSSAPGTKIGGYVQWIQDFEIPNCECGQEMEHLLTVASAEFDGGNYPRWLALEDQYTWDGSYEELNATQCAAGLMLGDMGSIYLFICRECENWPIAWVCQCS